MDNQRLEQLFQRYEQASDKLNLETIAEFYPDYFLSAGPKGTIAQGKADFVKKAPQAADFYRSIGWNSARIISKKIIPISNEYCLITAHWGVTFKKTGDRMIEFDVSYLVQATGEELRIILFISHEDEEETMKELGLQPPSANG